MRENNRHNKIGKWANKGSPLNTAWSEMCVGAVDFLLLCSPVTLLLVQTIASQIVYLMQKRLLV